MLSRRTFLRSVAAAGPAALLGRSSLEALTADRRQVVQAPYAIVLGTAQDGGMPQAGCYTDRCNRARRADPPRYVTSLALVLPEPARSNWRRYYLVDASPDLRQQIDLIDEPSFRERAGNRRPFDGIFLTHAHIGHYAGLALLGREGMAMASTPCYCSEEMRRFLTNNGPWRLLVEEGRIHFPEIGVDSWQEVDVGLQVRMLPVPHRPEFSDTVGFQFRGLRRTILYLPDIDAWNRWNRRIEDVVDEVDIALLDGSFWSADEVPGRRVEEIPHPLIPDTMARLEPLVARGKRVVFTHLNNTNPALDEGSAEAARVEQRGFLIAREGMRFPL